MKIGEYHGTSPFDIDYVTDLTFDCLTSCGEATSGPFVSFFL